MIPIQLTIEGLYSYQTRQTIDFNNLIEAGLFGIFGAVGSGKSSILEAITFALYGETERLNSRDKRAYNMMNLKSNRSYIEFDFINYQDRIFRVTREFKRNSKRFDDVKLANAVFFEQKDSEWIPLEHTNAEELIGLSYQNFKRTIIIPQGQFKEFIELGATDRTKMMKEIFNLHRFDLQDKVAGIAKKNQSAIDQLEGKLSGFEEVSEEYITELKTQLSSAKETTTQVQNEYDLINEKFQQLKALKSDFESLKQKKITFESQTQQKVEIDQQKAELEQYELIYNSFHQILLNQSSLQVEIDSKTVSIEDQQKQLALIEHQINTIKTNIAAIQSYHEALPTKRKEENDLELVVQILKFTLEIEELKNRTKKGGEEVEEVKKNQLSIENEIKKEELELKSLTDNKINHQVLLEVGNWFNQAETIKATLQQIKNRIAEKQAQVESYQQKLSEENISAETFEQEFKLQLEALESKKDSLTKTRNDLEVQQKLAHFAHNLHEGENCPLCGAIEHPKVLKGEDVSTEISAVITELNELKDTQKRLTKKQNDVQQILNQKQFISEQLTQDFSDLKKSEEELSSHLESFSWKDFEATNFELFLEKKKEANEIEQAIIAKNNGLIALREALEKERQKVEIYSKKLEEFKLKEVEKASQISQNSSNLKVLNFDDFKNDSAEQVNEKWINLKANNQKVEEDYQQLSKELNDYQLKLEAQKSAVQVLEAQILVHQSDLKLIDQSIKEALLANKLNAIAEVKTILAKKLNVTEIRKVIEQFNITYETLRNSIAELELKLAQVSFDETLYQTTEEKLNVVAQQLKEANDSVAKLSAEISRLEKAFEDKKELLKEFEQLQKRAANLKTLQTMFYKAGFVNYVSSIYLKQLCENANARFHRMTKNQLSLQMSDDNEFEIIDYLNEGHARSVKTLSGGQAFQVSLSLALALAESVQSSSKADRNFFFIDEGFGTQDADAVNIVFETLNHLHKENRIVGIISHVEELKERIPMALNIVKDEENGSQILF